MRKISNRSTLIIPQPPHPTISTTIPINILPTLSKYDSRLKILHRLSFQHINSHKCHKPISFSDYASSLPTYLKQHLHHDSIHPPKHIISHYYNLKTYKIENALSVDFVYFHGSKLQNLKMINVENILMNDCNFMIYKIVMINMEFDIVKKMLAISGLDSIKLVNVEIQELESIKNVKNISLRIDNLKPGIFKESRISSSLSKFNFIHYTKFRFKSDTFEIKFNRTLSSKNILYLKNKNIEIDASDFFNIMIENCLETDHIISNLNCHDLKSLSIIKCNIDEDILMKFIRNYDKIECINFSCSNFNVNVVIEIVKRNYKTLRMLNLDGVKMTSRVMEYARMCLVRCKIIYNDGRSVIVRN